MSDHVAGVRLLAECVERGLDVLGKDETQMAIKRQDVKDLRGVLAKVEQLRAKIAAALALHSQESHVERAGMWDLWESECPICKTRGTCDTVEALKGEEEK